MKEETKAPVRKRQKLIEVGLFLFLAMILAAILSPPRHHNRLMARRRVCLSNLKQIALSVRQYTNDYEGRFPPVSTSRPHFGWADAIQPHLKSTQVYQCPAEQNSPQPDPTQPQYTDYWFNARVSSNYQTDISQPMRTILLGEGNDGTDATNARYHLLELPAKWRDDTNSPLHRYLGFANFAFVDGHVKGLPAKTWKNNVSNHRGATFLLGSGKVRN